MPLTNPPTARSSFALAIVLLTQTGLIPGGIFLTIRKLFMQKNPHVTKLLLMAYANFVLWDQRYMQVRRPKSVPGWLQGIPEVLGEFFEHELVFDTKEESAVHEVPSHFSASMGPFVFSTHPHGIFGTASMFAWPKLANLLIHSPHGRVEVKHCGIRGVFYVPIFRELAIGLNSMPVDYDLMLKHLNENVSLTVVPGGASEALVSGGGNMTLVLKERKGFARLAVASGARLVPILHFGESNTFSQVHAEFLRKIQVAMMKNVGFTLPVVWPWVHRQKIVTVVGRPLDRVYAPLHDSAAFEKAVDRLHEEYVAKLRELFEKNKTTYGSVNEQEMRIVSSAEVANEFYTSKL